MMPDRLSRIAGLSALLAVPLWLMVAGAQALAFIGAEGSITRFVALSIAILLILLVLPAIAVYRLCHVEIGWWVSVVSALGILGMLVGAAAEGLDFAGNITDGALRIALLASGALLLAWIAAVAYLGIYQPQVPTPVGWFAFGVIVAGFLAGASTIAQIEVGIWITSTVFAAVTTFALLEFGWGFARQG